METLLNNNKEWNMRKKWEIEEGYILKQKLNSNSFPEFKRKCNMMLKITYPEVFKKVYWDCDLIKKWIEEGAVYFRNFKEYYSYVINYLELELDEKEFKNIYNNWKKNQVLVKLE